MSDTNTRKAPEARVPEARIPSGDDAGTRLDGDASDATQTVAAKSDLDRMLHALRPLDVRRGDGQTQTLDDGDLVVLGRLGEGGMGVVELAEQRSLGREVALKRLRIRPEREADGYALLDEARIHGSLEHPNVAPVHAVGVDPEFGPIVVLKRVTGESWARSLRADAERLPSEPDALERHLRVLIQVCHALDYAHSRGVLHRDIKPENVMLGAFGEVYLMDWGLALRRDPLRPSSGPIAIAGTPAFMAPEMISGDAAQIDERTDVFLLGATLHFVLTGTPRHLADTVAATMLRAVQSVPCVYDDRVSPDLGAITNRACAAAPELRFANVRAFREALEGYLALRETHALVASAERLIDDFVGGDVRPLFQAQFALDQALRSRPGLAVARRARRRCLTRMLEHALAGGALTNAEALATELGDDLPTELGAAIDALRTRQSSERARIAQLERDADPELANLVRLRAIAVAFAMVTLTQGLHLYFDPGPGFDSDARVLVLIQLAVVVLGGGYVALRGRDLDLTAIDRQFAQAVVGTMLAGLVSRIAGVIEGADVPTIMARDTMIMGAILLSVRVPLAGAWMMGLVGLALGLVSAYAQGLARYLHVAFVELAVLGVLVDLIMESRAIATTRGS